ncbi:PspC domain-containing protein [Clostridia bacterium]|nr:PspC domain-containing protein [Clostridia bacterium]GHV34036.1 PspC domain-containing protein [Clostridia bacterium]
MKRITKSRNSRMICGVCGGLAEYLNLDPSIIRILWVIFCLMAGTGLLAYIICAIILPEEA